jgi:hypothetical protein
MGFAKDFLEDVNWKNDVDYYKYLVENKEESYKKYFNLLTGCCKSMIRGAVVGSLIGGTINYSLGGDFYYGAAMGGSSCAILDASQNIIRRIIVDWQNIYI